MKREDAYQLLDFIQGRVFAWTLAIGCDNPRGRMDSRYASVKRADRLLRDAFLSKSSLDDCINAFERDEDPALQWPEPFQEFIYFCLHHRCPREINEPLNGEPRGEMPAREWPEFLHEYNKPATLADLPPLPEPSERLLDLERRQKEARS